MLCLQQIRGKVIGPERRKHTACNCAIKGLNHRSSVVTQGMAKGIIRRNEEPVFAALLDDGSGRSGGCGMDVISVMNTQFRARFLSKCGGAGASINGYDAFVGSQFLH